MSTKLTALRYIWTAYGLTMSFFFLSLLMTGNPMSAGYVVMAMGISIMAFLSTAVVSTVLEEQTLAAPAAKSKRRAKPNLDHLLANLDESDLRDLRDRLQADDDYYLIDEEGELLKRR